MMLGGNQFSDPIFVLFLGGGWQGKGLDHTLRFHALSCFMFHKKIFNIQQLNVLLLHRIEYRIFIVCHMMYLGSTTYILIK